jgi:sulfur-oxidizing protein SoxY
MLFALATKKIVVTKDNEVDLGNDSLKEATSTARGLSRRDLLSLTLAAVGLSTRAAWPGSPERRPADDPALLSPEEREHLPSVRLPERTRNGAKVPIAVEMSHPMTPDHHVTSLEVVNETDPIPSKGIFHFTPANGAVYIAFQARMDEGDSEVTVTTQCNRDRRSAVRRRISIPEDAGGCTGTAPPWGRAPGNDMHPPQIRIVELVQRGRIRRGEVIHPQLKMRHPNRTGLAERDGSFVRVSEPLYLNEMEVWFGGDRVSRFEFTPALSDDPFITFALLASREGPLEISLVNNRGQRFETAHEIRFS